MAACMIIAGDYTGLRGEKIAKIDVEATRKHWDASIKHVGYLYVSLMFSRKFKNKQFLKYFVNC